MYTLKFSRRFLCLRRQSQHITIPRWNSQENWRKENAQNQSISIRIFWQFCLFFLLLLFEFPRSEEKKCILSNFSNNIFYYQFESRVRCHRKIWTFPKRGHVFTLINLYDCINRLTCTSSVIKYDCLESVCRLPLSPFRSLLDVWITEKKNEFFNVVAPYAESLVSLFLIIWTEFSCFFMHDNVSAIYSAVHVCCSKIACQTVS